MENRRTAPSKHKVRDEVMTLTNLRQQLQRHCNQRQNGTKQTCTATSSSNSLETARCTSKCKWKFSKRYIAPSDVPLDLERGTIPTRPRNKSCNKRRTTSYRCRGRCSNCKITASTKPARAQRMFGPGKTNAEYNALIRQQNSTKC